MKELHYSMYTRIPSSSFLTHEVDLPFVADRKSLQDIHIILNYMADFSMTARVQDLFAVHILSSEDEPF